MELKTEKMALFIDGANLYATAKSPSGRRSFGKSTKTCRGCIMTHSNFRMAPMFS
jgi:hypothetical protein